MYINKARKEVEHLVIYRINASIHHDLWYGLRPIQWKTKTEVRNNLEMDSASFVFGFLGRLAKQKNPQMAIRCFAMIASEHPQSRLAMVGTGPLEDDCRRLAVELDVDDRIDWLGFRTANETMPAFDAFLMPSRYEGMPYVMMEAISLGLPVIATKVGGTSLGIDDGDNGFVVPIGDDRAFGNAMNRLLNQCDRVAMREAALKKAETFSVRLMAERTSNAYRSLLGTSAQPIGVDLQQEMSAV